MKYVLSGLFIFLLSSQNLKAKELYKIKENIINKDNQQQQEDTTPLILQQFGGVVLSFLNLLKDPDDKDHAFTQVGNMVQGMINIGTLAIRRHNKELLKQNFKEFFETDEGKSFLLYWQDIFNIV